MRTPTPVLVLLSLTVTALAACSPDGGTGPLAPAPPSLATSQAAAVAARASGPELPFRGKLTATETEQEQPDMNAVLIRVEGTGTATHLGRFTFVSDFLLDLETLTATEQMTLTAANGDVLTATVVAEGIPLDDVMLATVENATITGGTGRFADASGSFVLQRLLNTGTRASTGSFVGTISLAH